MSEQPDQRVGDANASPALKEQSKLYPARFGGRVPKTVLMLKTVTADWPFGFMLPHEFDDLAVDRDKQYPVWVNSHGAVSAIMSNGKQLGLKPDEFQVVEWHERGELKPEE